MKDKFRRFTHWLRVTRIDLPMPRIGLKRNFRRIVHRLFFALLAVTTLLVLFYAEENWRGARAWDAARRELQAKGESLDPNDFIPPPVPDDQNLAMAPLFVRLFQYQVNPATKTLTFGRNWENPANNPTFKTMQDMPWGSRQYDRLPPASRGSWTTAHGLDLVRAQAHFRQRPEFPKTPQPQTPADDALLALTRYAPLLDELAQTAADRPRTRFPIDYKRRPFWSINLPHYFYVQNLAATLCLRAEANLANSQKEPAKRDIALAFRLRQALADDPILIAGLVDNTLVGTALGPIWRGLEARQWSGAELDGFRDQLSRIHLLREYQQGIRGGERAFFMNHLLEDLQSWTQAREFFGAVAPMFLDDSGKGLNWIQKCLPYFPRGWYARGVAIASRLQQEYLVEAVDPANHRVFVAKNKGLGRALDGLAGEPGDVIAKYTLNVFRNIALNFARTQAAVDQAIIACALEKYYLDRKVYPAALDALVPAYLDRVPNDVIDGAPMRYRLTVDGRYQLYSIGWDEKDDGGTIEWPADRTWRRNVSETPNAKSPAFPSPIRDRGDWVWQYTPADPPDPPDNQSRLESLP